MKQYEMYTASMRNGSWVVFGWDEYPPHSVLAGQPRRNWLDSFETLELAQAKYPHAQPSNAYTDPQVSLSHLPGPDDPVAGGMYPDDWE
jgi:hypothetical protein